MDLSNSIQLHSMLQFSDPNDHLPLLSMPEQQTQTSAIDSVSGDAVDDDHLQIGIPAPVPITMNTSETAACFRSFSRLLPIEKVDPINYPTAVTLHNQRRLKEPTAQDWDLLRPIILVLYIKHSLKQVREILRNNYGLKIR